MVSITLLMSAAAFIYAGWLNVETLNIAVTVVSITYVIFSFIFVCVGWYFFGYRTFIKLPQWILLLPIGILGCIGAI